MIKISISRNKREGSYGGFYERHRRSFVYSLKSLAKAERDRWKIRTPSEIVSSLINLFRSEGLKGEH